MKATSNAAVVPLSVLLAFSAAVSATMTADQNVDWGVLSGRTHSPKCVDIPENMSMCHNIGYNRMRLPNLLEHDNLGDATHQSMSWKPLVGVQCHPDTRIFLCSLYAPICLEKVIYPCKSFCISVRNSCEKRMNAHGFSWPDMFDCDKFPPDTELCLPRQTADPKEKEVESAICPACNEPDTYEGILHNHCTADFVMKVNVTSHVKKGRNLVLTIEKGKRKIFFKGEPEKKTNASAPTEPRKKKDAGRSAETKFLNSATLMYTNSSASCSCSGRIQNNSLHMVAGYRDKITGKVHLSFITQWMSGRQTKRSVKLALKAFQVKGLCVGGLTTLDVHKKTEEEVENEEKRNKLRNR